jgi:hypothetical protein
MARYLIDGVVYFDAAGTQPVPASDPYYYSAAEDEAAQRAAQLAAANDDLRRRQEANAAAWASGQALPYPDAGFPPGYVDPFGGYVPGTQPRPRPAVTGDDNGVAQFFAGSFGGLPTWVLIIGAVAVVASMRKR